MNLLILPLNFKQISSVKNLYRRGQKEFMIFFELHCALRMALGSTQPTAQLWQYKHGYRLYCVPPNPYVEVPTPHTSECDLFGSKGGNQIQ